MRDQLVGSNTMTDDGGISFLESDCGKAKPGIKRSNESADCPVSASQRRRIRESYLSPSEVIIKVISASYGPYECNGFNDNDDDSPIPLTRDCTSFLLDLLVAAKRRECQDLGDYYEQGGEHRRIRERDRCNNIVRFPPTVDGKIQSFVYLLPGVSKSSGDYTSPSTSKTLNSRRQFSSMNAFFGDPCPGITKRLEVKYTVTEVFTKKSGSEMLSTSGPPHVPTEIHRVSFAEHEAVKLRRYLTAINTMTTAREAEEFEKDIPGEPHTGYKINGCAYGSSGGHENKKSRQLQSDTSEIVLPIILPFLALRERMQCRSICRCWKDIVQECGVSRTIDVNSTDMTSSGRSGAVVMSTSRNTFTRGMLRGLLAYSYSSLQSLFLSGFEEIQKKDLHPALTSLRNLQVLDISHCTSLDDSTLKILAQPDIPCSTTIRVLYLKALRRITDIGLKAICTSCSRLEVLDLSHLSNITDEGARFIQRLVFLRALFLRDNWQLTNDSIDAITTMCSKLEQLTLWGCVRLRYLKFDSDIVNAHPSANKRLVILNLWGCHDLEDDAAHVLSEIPNLNCLIVSECHRLTDRFVQILVDGAEQKKLRKGGLRHLHLRYLKRITDASVIAIALKLRDLFSLDLSFCSKVTATGIYQLLDELRDSLVELRLKSCRGLQIGTRTIEEIGRRWILPRQNNGNGISSSSNHAGHWILNALRRQPHSRIDHSLCLLDVRGCGGQPGANLPYTKEDPFTKGMCKLQFKQIVPGFFSRSV